MVLISSLQIFEVLAFSVIHGFILLVLVNCVASHTRICGVAGAVFVLSSDFCMPCCLLLSCCEL